MTAMALSAMLLTSHRTMPNLIPNADLRDDIIAYVLRLRRTQQRSVGRVTPVMLVDLDTTDSSWCRGFRPPMSRRTSGHYIMQPIPVRSSSAFFF
jgi:hypothetical protein